MDSIVKVTSLGIDDNRLRVEFETHGDISKIFKGKVFEIEYGDSISSTPGSIAIIPFVANVLPIVWVYDAELVVNELDKDFYDNIAEIKKGYESMYPGVDFGGRLVVNSLVKNKTRAKQRKTALLFSGGADATSSLVTMLKSGDKPHLITLWGSDVLLKDVNGWNEKYSHTKNISKLFNLGHSYAKTEFRTFINEYLLDKKIESRAGDKWWHGFQHGIGIISHVAPLAYAHGFDEVHIAASFTVGDNMTCASDPSIDEHVRMGSAKVIHNGFDLTRQNKLKNIQQYIKNLRGIDSMPIKVCLASRDAKNCGRCEKCMRTACGFIAEGGDVDFYAIERFDARFAEQYVKKVHYFRHTLHWGQIQTRLYENRNKINYESDNRNIDWLLDVDLEKINNYMPKRIKHYTRTVARPIARLMPYGAKKFIRKALNM